MIRSVNVVDVVKSNKVFGFAHLHLLAKSVSFDNKRTCKYNMTPLEKEAPRCVAANFKNLLGSHIY